MKSSPCTNSMFLTRFFLKKFGLSTVLICVFLPLFAYSVDNSSFNKPSILEKDFVLLQNKNLLPIQDLSHKRIGVLSLPNNNLIDFERMGANYCPIQRIDALGPENNWDLLIVGIDMQKVSSENWTDLRALLPNLENYIIVFFGEAQMLANYHALDKVPALLQVESISKKAQEQAMQVLFGGLGTMSKLNEAIPPYFQKGAGINLEGNIRLSYGTADDIGWDTERLNRRLDSIIQKGIEGKAFPGCQLLVAKDQKVIVHNSYGYHTYAKKRPVNINDLYDFASVTKVTGPLPALMKLHSEKKLDLDSPLSNYWPDFKRKDKKDLLIRDVLAHQARLKAYIVYWAQTVKKDGRFKGRTFKHEASEKYSIAVSPDLFLHKKYRKKIYKAIRKSPLNPESGYVYSGLSFLLYPQIIADLSGIPFNQYVQEKFYRPIGAFTLGYNPYKRFPLDRIVPTEEDTIFRKRLVHGWVHDEAAAMFEGVSGNAGLFGSANDLAKLMQMYLNKGTYGGEQLISASSVEEFTSYQFPEQMNRRGLGFDKPLLENQEQGYVAIDASEKSFGHSGFTGTFTWADPEHNLLIVFLSNRVYPTRDNRNLYNMNIRPSLHQVLYDEIKKGLQE